FRAEDGIRDFHVTGVQTCALPISTVGGFTLVSRVTGFVRDILIAAILGAGPVADAFFVAFKLPNFFRRLTGEGALTVAFVPLFEIGRASCRARAERRGGGGARRRD